MFHSNSSGTVVFRLSLIGAVCLSLAASIRSQAPRVPYRQAPIATSNPANALPGPTNEQRQAPTTGTVLTKDGIDPESDTPSELRHDPTPGLKGDEWAQQPIPEYLKGNPYRLSYIGGDYTPPANERIDPSLLRYWKLNRGKVNKTYGFVMFQGKITAAKIKRVEAMGVKLDTFHTFQCYSAVIPFKTIPALLGSTDVRWIGYAKSIQKIDPELALKMGQMTELERSTTKTHLFVNVYESDLGSASEFIEPWPLIENGDLQTPVSPTRFMMSNGKFQKALQAFGSRVYAYHPDNKVFQLEAPYAIVAELAKLDWVHFIETIYPVDLDHDRSTRQVGVDRVRSSTMTDGSSTVVGLLDTGAYMGAGKHKDLNKSGIGWNFNGGLGSVFSEAHGHGTHVLGTIGGTGTANNRYKGCAPAIGGSGTTRLFIGKIIGVSTTGTYPNNTLAAFTQFHKNYKDSGNKVTPYPHVVSNSWGYGSRTALGYTGTDNISLAVDTQSYFYKQLYVFSASNTGGSSTVQYLRSMRRPNVSKNALTVASNYDSRGTVGTKTVEAGYPTFSSGKGPTRDGRFKPNIMAPGASIRSCLTKTTSSYTNKSGTSMATPHVAGIAAGVMDHLSTLKRRPSLAKAFLASQTNSPTTSRSWSSASNSYYYRQGLGQIDAYKSNWQSNGTKGWANGYRYGTFSSTSTGASFDLTIPADAKSTFFVLNFDEKAASPGATRSTLADLDLYIDVAGFSTGFNTGEYSSKRANDTWEWYGNVASIASVRGKKVRIKIYPRVRPKPGTFVHWAVGYLFPRGPSSSAGTISGTITATSSKTYLKPNETTNVYAYVNVPSWVQTNSLVEMYNTGGFTVLSLNHTSVDNLLRTYTSTSLFGSGDSLFNWTLGYIPYFSSSTHRRVYWSVRKSTNGTSNICFRLRSDNRPGATSTTVCRQLCVDGLAPNTVSGLTSTTHPANVWKRSSSFLAKWIKPTDTGCAGISGLAYSLTSSPTSVPTTRNIFGAVTGKALTLGNTSGSYFHIRAVDRSGNLSSSTRHFGPIRVDLTKPALTKVLINVGAPYTRSLSVKVSIAAKDTYSGLYRMRFSSNGLTWTAWRTYSAAAQLYSLNLYGGSTAQGIKRVYAQVMDRAGNLSLSGFDTIIYDSLPPLLSSVVINNGAPYTRSSIVGVRATGTGAVFMQHSFNGTTWSPLTRYTSTTKSLSVGSLGGSTRQGTKTAYVRLRDLAGNYSAVKSDQIIYDSVAPVITAVRINGNAPFTKSTNVVVQVLAAGAPARVRYSFNGTTWSSWMSYTTGNRSMSVSSYGGNSNQGTKTVYAQVLDAAGNLSLRRSDSITYDSTAPVVTTVRINNGATYTSSTIVTVQVLGIGSPSQVQYSFNGSTWSAWMGYTTGSRSLNMTNYGGNANTGQKTVYARLRDGALNESTVKKDSIVYYKVPTIGSSTGTTVTVIHDNKITLNGSGFADVNRAYVGSDLITSRSPEDWHKGYFRVLSDAKMEVYPPQNLKPGTYTCYVRNTAFRSTNYSATVVHSRISRTGVPPLLKSGKVLHVYTHRGARPATTLSVLTFSVSSKPLILPGLISLGHGGNATTFIDPSFTVLAPGQLHNATTRTAHWAFPTPVGKIAGLLYWQSVMFNASNPTATPIPTSTTDVVKFYK